MGMPPGPGHGRTAAVIPAAGRSRRMGGRNKPLLPVPPDGRTFLQRCVDTLREAGCDPVLVVVRSGDAAVGEAAHATGATILENPDPGDGPITSVQQAVRALPEDVEALLLHPVDHPLVDAATVRALLDARRASATPPPVVVPEHGGRSGHPVLFDRSLFAELLDEALPEGARSVVRRAGDRVLRVPVEDAAVLLDVDTPARYRRDVLGLDAARRLGPAQAAARLLEAREAGRPAALWTAVTDAAAGRRLLVLDDGPVLGGLGDPDLDARAERLARAALLARSAEPAGLRLLRESPPLEAYLELHLPPATLIVVGAGHIARPLADAGALLGLRVVVLDDRPEFADSTRFPTAERVLRIDPARPFADVDVRRDTAVVLVTRGHKYDAVCLRALLERDPPPGYVGMIGSRRRVRATYEALAAEGIDPARLADVHAPVGLDVGAETPAEIAVAVAAELVLRRRGGSGRPLRDVERVVERFFAGRAP